jgi:hypothetical protein
MNKEKEDYAGAYKDVKPDPSKATKVDGMHTSEIKRKLFKGLVDLNGEVQ